MSKCFYCRKPNNKTSIDVPMNFTGLWQDMLVHQECENKYKKWCETGMRYEEWPF